jgi:hypothetical protein
MKTTASIDNSINGIQKPENEAFQELVRSTVEEMAARRIEQLGKSGADADRPEIKQFIKQSLQSQIDSLGKRAIETIEDKIALIKAQRK